MAARRVVAGLALLGFLAGCSGETQLEPAAERGRQTYLANCTACHAPDPAQPGAVGPPIKGSARDLLEAKVLRGAYPPGYAPKRPSAVMQPMPQLAGSIDDLAAYLR
jgi:mono/diheme cytochrome c family protein